MQGCTSRTGGTSRLIICPGYFMQYIWQLTSRQRSVRAQEGIVNDINNVRNGLFLDKNNHSILGKQLGFLVVCLAFFASCPVAG